RKFRTLLNQIAGESNPSRKRRVDNRIWLAGRNVAADRTGRLAGRNDNKAEEAGSEPKASSAGRERELGRLGVFVGGVRVAAVRAAGAA
ncbi:hypothetical protein ABTO95_18745, partial [Acinetobacter baumannii]